MRVTEMLNLLMKYPSVLMLESAEDYEALAKELDVKLPVVIKIGKITVLWYEGGMRAYEEELIETRRGQL